MCIEAENSPTRQTKTRKIKRAFPFAQEQNQPEIPPLTEPVVTTFSHLAKANIYMFYLSVCRPACQPVSLSV